MTAITPKPMTKERRAEIEKVESEYNYYSNDLVADAIHDALADAAFWREAVMRVEPAHADNCCFCGYAFGDALSVTAATHHRPDCPWLRA